MRLSLPLEEAGGASSSCPTGCPWGRRCRLGSSGVARHTWWVTNPDLHTGLSGGRDGQARGERAWQVSETHAENLWFRTKAYQPGLKEREPMEMAKRNGKNACQSCPGG